MAIQFGNDKIKEIYVGSDKIKEVYHGSDLVWSGAKPSYLIKTDGTRVDFEMDNTPINTFSGQAVSSMNVNGVWVTRRSVRELCFGESYAGVASLPSYFLYNFTGIRNVDLSILTNVTTIGSYAFSNFGGTSSPYVSVNLITLANLASIGVNFMNNSNVGRLTLGAISAPTTSLMHNFFNNTEISEIVVPCQSVDAYKSALGWNTKASIIKCEEIIDPETSFVMFKNSDVNWVDGWGHGDGTWSVGDKLILTASGNKVSSVMTNETFKLTDYGKLRIKWNYTGAKAHANNILRIQFRNSPDTGMANRIRYDAPVDSANETLTINLADITNGNKWDSLENYRVLIYAYGYTATPVNCEIEEMIFY